MYLNFLRIEIQQPYAICYKKCNTYLYVKSYSWPCISEYYFEIPRYAMTSLGLFVSKEKGQICNNKKISEGDLLVPFLCAAVHVIFPFSPHPTVAPFLSIRLILQ